LTAKWSGGGTPIAAVAANDIPTSFTYLNNNAGTYTLLINRDISIDATQTMNLAQRHLSIVGLGTERKVIYTGTVSNLFHLNNIDASLTIDENITLIDNNRSFFWWGSYYLVYVQAGSLVMKVGSKMTDAPNNAVYVTGANSSFTMEGGEIIGNRNSDDGAVHVTTNAAFFMRGGKITNNPVDVLINYNSGIFTFSGNAEIATLVLNKENNGKNASITIGEGGYSGIVSALHLRVENSNMNSVVDQWTTGVTVPAVLKGVNDVSVLSRFTLGKFVSSANSSNQRDISPDYKLELVGGGEAKLVWR